jgi:hypothetical protein
MINDFTIVIQGRCELEQLQLWIDNYSDWNVVLSTWNDFDLNVKFPKNWKIVKSEYPTFTFDCQNLEKQVVSTLTGLKEVNTEYVIKVRGDEYFSKLDLVYKIMKQNLPKVLCSSVCFRPLWLYPFHISDHFICSTTKNIKLMFEKCLEMLSNVNKFNNCPETHLGFSFIAGKENLNLFNLENYLDRNEELMKKWYQIIDINELQPYIVTESNIDSRIYYRDNYGYSNHHIKEL